MIQNKWAWVTLIALSLSILFNCYWIWGGILLTWLFLDLRSGTTWLSETVYRTANPVLFYLIMLCWLGLGLYFLSELLYIFS